MLRTSALNLEGTNVLGRLLHGTEPVGGDAPPHARGMPIRSWICASPRRFLVSADPRARGKTHVDNSWPTSAKKQPRPWDVVNRSPRGAVYVRHPAGRGMEETSLPSLDCVI